MSFPSPASDYVEVGLNWNHYLIRHPASTFPMRMKGQSMEPLICENDYVIVDRSLNPKNGDIVVAVYQNELILKRFVKNDLGLFLKSENPQFQTIPIQNCSDFELWGIVTFSIQQHRAQ